MAHPITARDGGNRRNALDRPAIVAAALDLLDEVGIDGLSTRVLAARLGVKGPSLYWHFKNRRALLDHMAEALLADALPAPDAMPGDWRGWLAAGARGIRRAAMSRRDGARVMAGAQPTGEGAVDFAAMTGRLVNDGFSPFEARASLMALGRYALGWVLDEQIAPGRTAASEADFEFGLGAMLRGISPTGHG